MLSKNVLEMQHRVILSFPLSIFYFLNITVSLFMFIASCNKTCLSTTTDPLTTQQTHTHTHAHQCAQVSVQGSLLLFLLLPFPLAGSLPHVPLSLPFFFCAGFREQ